MEEYAPGDNFLSKDGNRLMNTPNYPLPKKKHLSECWGIMDL